MGLMNCFYHTGRDELVYETIESPDTDLYIYGKLIYSRGGTLDNGWRRVFPIIGAIIIMYLHGKNEIWCIYIKHKNQLQVDKILKCERETFTREYSFYDFDTGKDFLNMIQRMTEPSVYHITL